MSSKAKSEIDREDSASFKKSVHTTMTSRVLDDHAKKEKDARFFSTRIIGSENMNGSKSSKLLQSISNMKGYSNLNSQRSHIPESPGVTRFIEEK